MEYISTELILVPFFFSVVGTLLTIVVIWKFKPILRRYFAFRSKWVQWQEQLPRFVHVLIKAGIAAFGIIFLVIGVLLMPLPGPGWVVIVSSVALLDLEFGWILPFMEWVTERLPEKWISDQFLEFLDQLKHQTETGVRRSNDSE